MDLNLEFRNIEQEAFYWSKSRNNCFSGGFGNGKTYVALQRAFTMLASFPGYRYAIARQKYKTLKSTTMQTFLKICPKEFIFKHDETEGITVLVNKSVIYWMHLDAFNEQDLRGLEINSVLVDQAEEILENIYLVLDARVGRWDGAKVPEKLLAQFPNWPLDKFGRPRVPNFLDVLTNPDDDFHFVYKRYHPNSYERQPDHFYIERETDEDLNDPGTIKQLLNRDQEWIDKYYKGKWGSSKSKIHRISELSYIDPDKMDQKQFDDFIHVLKTRGALYRVLDHGLSGITCCVWVAALNKVHIFYREFYVEGYLISESRIAINELTGDEEIYADYADPSIFKKTSQRDGGFWSVADEYMDTEEITAPALFWTAADNNEFATRNRINELLRPSHKFMHPITRESPAPGIYFIKRTTNYQFGCHQLVIQTESQRRSLIGSDNGRNIYSEDRDDNIVDHAYDTLRYYIAMHNVGKPEELRAPPRRSFANFERIRKNRPNFQPMRETNN